MNLTQNEKLLAILLIIVIAYLLYNNAIVSHSEYFKSGTRKQKKADILPYLVNAQNERDATYSALVNAQKDFNNNVLQANNKLVAAQQQFNIDKNLVSLNKVVMSYSNELNGYYKQLQKFVDKNNVASDRLDKYQREYNQAV